jgi:formyltetrahydrofolate deformylase
MSVTATLLLSCPDRPGLVATVADFVFRNGGNILHADQHIDTSEGVFFQRVEVDLDGFLPRGEIEEAFAPIAERCSMRTAVRFSDEVARIAILVSKQPHCLFDLLGRWQAGELQAEIPLVVSNHLDHADAVRLAGPVYQHLPITADTRAEQERGLLDHLRRHEIDLVVLARYMQVLGAPIIDAYRGQVINIHHSFLPAFTGGDPYRRAHERGVKLIGATAHYATEDLDEGPIIEQDVVRVTHRDTAADMARKGRDLERIVLARALRAHLEHRVLTYGNKTLVFE